MAGGFKVRRDSSNNNVPVVGYQDAADAQDVILWVPVQVTETGNTDAQGNFWASNLPIIDVTHDWVTDGTGTGRERLIDEKDITAHDSNNNPLYAGEANGQTGQIPLYTDSGRTTSAVNKQNVTVTYWTLKPVAADSQGRLLAVVSGTLSATLTGALPAGSNNIGKVDINSLPSLPAGSNTVGQFIVWNPLDGPGPGEQGSVRIRDSMAGNPLAAMGYTTDNKPIPSSTGFPLAVSALPWLLNSNGNMDRVTGADKHPSISLGPGNTSGTIWTPATGKAAYIRGFVMVMVWTGTAPTNPPTAQFAVGGTNFGPAWPLGNGTPIFVEMPTGWAPGSAGQAISVSISNAPSSGWAFACMMWGIDK